jgi:hypothetical protein
MDSRRALQPPYDVPAISRLTFPPKIEALISRFRDRDDVTREEIIKNALALTERLPSPDTSVLAYEFHEIGRTIRSIVAQADEDWSHLSRGATSQKERETYIRFVYSEATESLMRRISKSTGLTRAQLIDRALDLYDTVPHTPREPFRGVDYGLNGDDTILYTIGSGIIEASRQINFQRSATQILRTSPRGQNRSHVIVYSQILITAIEEALEWNAVRKHNNPPPALRLEGPDYLQELRSLANELKRLNDLLERKAPQKIRTEAVHLAKHFDKFLSSYAGAMGKGAAGLTIGALAALLYHVGVGQAMIDDLWGHLKGLK